MQPWKIYLLHGETRDKFCQIVQDKFMNGQAIDLPLQFAIYPKQDLPAIGLSSKFKQEYPKFHERHRALGKLVYGSQGIEREDYKARTEAVKRNFNFFGAPIGLFITVDAGVGKGQYPDLGILLQTIMLLCQEHGLSTCCQVAWSLQHNTIRSLLNISSNEVIYCGIAIGYENTKSKVNQFRTERMKLNDMVIIPKIADHYQLESKMVSKLKLATAVSKYYIKGTLPYIKAFGCVAIGAALLRLYTQK